MKKIILLVILLSGCVAQPMHKQGATDQDAMRDNLECEVMAGQYATGLGFNGNLFIIGDFKTKCLRSRGWN